MISIIIPVYNEEDNLKKGIVEGIFNFVSKIPGKNEVVFVDDGSTDQTANIIQKLIKDKKYFKLIRNKHSGKAYTVITGLLESNGDIALFTDFDQATPLSEIEKLLPEFKDGSDIVIGSRAGREDAPFSRKFTAIVFATLRYIIIGLPFKDTQCGFKAFNRKAIDQIFPKLADKWKRQGERASVDAGFDVEVLLMAQKYKLKIAEVPVVWHHVQTKRVSLLKEALKTIKDLLEIRINISQGKYS